MNAKTGKPKDIGLDNIKKEVKRLQGRATTLQSKAIVRTDVNVEETRCAVTTIIKNTHNIERILVEELRPVINEMHYLVQEIRLSMGSHAKENWLTDFYPKVTWVMDFRARANGLDVGLVSTKGRLRRNVDPMGSLLIFGRPGEFMELKLGNLQEKLIGQMANIRRQLNSTYPIQGEKSGDLREKVSYLFGQELMMFLFSKAFGATKANTLYRRTVSWDLTTRRVLMQLDWYLECKTPIHRDDFTITDTFISPSRGTRCRIFLFCMP